VPESPAAPPLPAAAEPADDPPVAEPPPVPPPGDESLEHATSPAPTTTIAWKNLLASVFMGERLARTTCAARTSLDGRMASRYERGMKIDSDFDGGAIEVIRAEGPEDIELEIPHDTLAPDFRQWFAFRARGFRGKASRFTLSNAGQATYPDAFEGYSACASYDRKRWFRVPTSFDGERLVIEHTPKTDDVVYSYFAPYPLDRHARMIKRAVRASWVTASVLGKSVEGRDMTMLTFGEEGDEKLEIWVIARQHPGETMAAWWAEGLVERLLDDDDEVTRAILERCVVRVVPNMNPDGSVHGNLRANAAGFNLNRAWQEPDPEISPEVLCVRDEMERTGVDLFLDVHGDERNPYCFLAGCEGNPGYSERLRFLENLFEQSLCDHNADFQDEYGYDRDEPGGGDLRTAGNWVGEAFDCLSYTVEMPFKDNANAPDEVAGWSPERSMHLGGSTLEAIRDCLGVLRGEIDLPEEGGDGDGPPESEEGDDEDA
jgi:murein tripeptide amidase MpaA